MKFSTRINAVKTLTNGNEININADFDLEIDVKEMTQMSLLCREDIASFVKFVQSGEMKNFVRQLTDVEFDEKQERAAKQHDLEKQKYEMKRAWNKERAYQEACDRIEESDEPQPEKTKKQK